jgi:hypothetical protein
MRNILFEGNMKRLLLTALLVAGLLPAPLMGQIITPLYQNGLVETVYPQAPPQIDATAWLCNLPFFVALPVSVNFGGGFPDIFSAPPYQTADTFNFTNNNEMATDNGFIFNAFTSSNGLTTNAWNFINNGEVFAGVDTNLIVPGQYTNNFFGIYELVGAGQASNITFATVPTQITAWATNLVSPGVLEIGPGGTLNLHGGNVDLSRGTVRVESVTDFPGGDFFLEDPISEEESSGATFNEGIFPESWQSIATNGVGSFALPTPFGGLTLVTNVPSGLADYPLEVESPNATAYANVALAVYLTNFANLNQAVFINNFDTNVTVSVRFADGEVPVIQWLAVVTNTLTGALVTNTIYLQDNPFALQNNGKTFNLVPNTPPTGLVPVATEQLGEYGVPPFAVQASSQPVNFTFSTAPFGFFTNFSSLPAGNSLYSPGFLAPQLIDGIESVLSVDVSPMTWEVYHNVPGATVSNLPGRIQITADQALNLKRTHIDGGNYLSITATNQFLGSPGAQIVSPNYALALGNTNGSVTVSNLVVPTIPVFSGQISCWDGTWVWTNPITSNITVFQATIISNGISATTPTTVQSLTLNSPSNVFISDVLNVTGNTLILSPGLTVTTNASSDPVPEGELSLGPQLIWSAVLPILEDVTNYGEITSQNSTVFESSQQPPYYPTTTTQPYSNFVNHGTISSSDVTIWANYFENTGQGAVTSGLVVTTNLASISAFSGDVSMRSTGTALMSNGIVNAPGVFQQISLTCNDLVISNQALQSGSTLTLAVANSINSTNLGGSPISTNYWSTGDGFNLETLPASGDLFATTVTNLAGVFIADTENTWAALDRGSNTNSFTNSVTIGHLILDGLTQNSVFSYQGATGGNAIYVDLLDFRDYATNRDPVTGDLTELDIDPSITIYFADAVFPGNVDATLTINGHNGGRLQWSTNYAGLFSSTNITFPDGRTFPFNRARVNDPFLPPVSEPTDPAVVMLSVKLTNAPAKEVLVSWLAPSFSANTLYYKTNFGSGTWQVFTNFTQGPASGQVTVVDKQKPGGRVYRALVSTPPQ